LKLLLIFSLLISSLFAHPHTFIDIHPTVKMINNNKFIINFKWMIDDMTSTMLMMELDQNGDGKLNKKESDYAKEEYFSIFKDYNYYTYILVKGKKVKFPVAKNFKASMQNNKICYSFDIELNQNIKDTVFEFGDTDFYVAMILKKEFVDTKGLPFTVTGVDNDFYYGYKLEFK